MSEYAIEMLGITKRFPGIIANDNITLQLKKGEIHALLGENGAGKSTLMSVLFGLYQPEEGEIHKDGKKVEIKDPNDANDLGIGMVHQHFMLIQPFTVTENIVLGMEPSKGIAVDIKSARNRIQDLSVRGAGTHPATESHGVAGSHIRRGENHAAIRVRNVGHVAAAERS